MTQPIVLRATWHRRRPTVWLALAVLLGAGWSGLWLMAQQQLVRGMDSWFAAEAARGRPWSCPNRGVSGYPFGLTLSCTKPTFTARIGGETIDGEVAGVQARTSLARPNTIRMMMTSPMTIRSDTQSDIAVLSWTGISIDLGVSLALRPRADVTVEALSIARPDQPDTHVDRAGVHVADVGTSGVGRDYSLLAQVAGAAIPDLDAATGTPAPLTVDAAAHVSALELQGSDAWQDLVERWRLARGRLEVDSLTYEKGSLRVSAAGQLSLDELHRPVGLLQTTITGYESFAAQLGLPVRAVSFGGALAGLLKGGSKTPAPPASTDRGSIALPVGFTDGRLAVGPFKTSLRLAPVY